MRVSLCFKGQNSFGEGLTLGEARGDWRVFDMVVVFQGFHKAGISLFNEEWVKQDVQLRQLDCNKAGAVVVLFLQTVILSSQCGILETFK